MLSVNSMLAVCSRANYPSNLHFQCEDLTAHTGKWALLVSRPEFADGIKVMSATQSWFGRMATKFRSTKPGAGRASRSRRIVTTAPPRRLAPTSPAVRISRAIRLRPCFSLPAWSAACTRGASYVSRELAWIVRIRFSSTVSAMARAGGRRRRQEG
jgi:hypothetical protein